MAGEAVSQAQAPAGAEHGRCSTTDRVYLELDVMLGIVIKLRIQLNERSKGA